MRPQRITPRQEEKLGLVGRSFWEVRAGRYRMGRTVSVLGRKMFGSGWHLVRDVGPEDPGFGKVFFHSCLALTFNDLVYFYNLSEFQFSSL